MINILAWLLFGALAGWIASLIMGTNGSQGAVSNIIVGVIGAMVGGFIVQLFGGSGVTGFNPYSLFVAIIGAVALLWVVKILVRATN